jgi:hypothetical protein|nr:hypothetical protein 12 [bacterium]
MIRTFIFSALMALASVPTAASSTPFVAAQGEFTLGMTKELAMERMRHNAGDHNAVMCTSSQVLNRTSEICRIPPAYRPNAFYGFPIQEMTLEFYQGRLDHISIGLDWGKPEGKDSYYRHSAFHQRVLRKIRKEMGSISMQAKPSNTWVWKNDGLTVDYNARHLKDDLFPAPYASKVTVSVYSDGYLQSLQAPAEPEPKPGWFSKLRQMAK